MMGIYYYTFVQIHKGITPRVDPKLNYGCWVIKCDNVGSSLGKKKQKQKRYSGV